MNPLLPAWLIAISLLLGVFELVRTPRPVYQPGTRRLPDATGSTPLPQSLATAEAGDDIVSYLKQQHEEIKALFAQTLDARGEARQEPFLALRRLMAAHEATEEELFHPVAERALGAKGHAVVMARMGEERAAATAMTGIERLPLDSMQFEMNLRQLESDVVAHATHEEEQEFRALSGMKSDRLERIREVARALYMDSRAAVQGPQMTRSIGPFVAMLSCARDILSGKTSYEVSPNEVRTGTY